MLERIYTLCVTIFDRLEDVTGPIRVLCYLATDEEELRELWRADDAHPAIFIRPTCPVTICGSELCLGANDAKG